MATLAYVFPPLTGLAVYLVGGSARERFHGLQAIALGLLAAITLYVASAISATITPYVFALWVVAWFLLIVATLVGKDLRLPGLGRLLRRAASEDPHGDPRR